MYSGAYLQPGICVWLLQAHSNETVGSLRNKIAKVLKVPAEQIQFLSNEKMVSRKKYLMSLFIDVCINIVAMCFLHSVCYTSVYMRDFVSTVLYVHMYFNAERLLGFIMEWCSLLIIWS